MLRKLKVKGAGVTGPAGPGGAGAGVGAGTGQAGPVGRGADAGSDAAGLGSTGLRSVGLRSANAETAPDLNLVSGRLSQMPSEALVRSAFAYEVAAAEDLSVGMGWGDIAYVLMLLDEDLISGKIAADLLYGLGRLLEGKTGETAWDPFLGDVYQNREQMIRDMVGASADWLSFGRARRESTTLGYFLTMRRLTLEYGAALQSLLGAICDRAAEHTATIVPDYTYLQAAQPTTFGHYLLGFAASLRRDLERLRAVYTRLNSLPAGIGSTNGSRLPINRRKLAESLAFGRLAEHTRDAMWMADVSIELLAVLQISLTNVDRLCEDLQIWATAEFDLVETADCHSRISVIMPQKKNPYSLSYLRGMCRSTLGKLVGVAAANLTPSGQIDNRLVAYQELPASFTVATKGIVLLEEVLRALTVKERRGEGAGGGSLLAGSELAELLVVNEKVSPKHAHRVVGLCVREAGGEPFTHAGLASIFQQVVGKPLRLTADEFTACVSPEEIIQNRVTEGGAHPDQVAGLVEFYGEARCEFKEWLENESRSAGEALTKLAARARRVVKKHRKG